MNTTKEHGWLRLYMRLMDNEDVHALTDAEFRTWIFCLLATKDNGGLLPPNKSLAFKARRKIQVIEEHIAALIAADLLIHVGDELQPTGWKRLQFDSDVSTERVKRFRQRKRNADETFHERSVTVAETPSDYRVQTTESKSPYTPPTPKYPPLYSPVEEVVLRFRQLHPKPSNLNQVTVFFAEQYIIMREDAERFTAWTQPIEASLQRWAKHWTKNGAQFAPKLTEWLRDEGWTKDPPAPPKPYSPFDSLED